MKLEAYLFGGLAVFMFGIAAIYGFYSDLEPVGMAGLVLSGGLSVIVGGFFWFVSRRIDPRPEDRKDADIADGAGELGFFSPGSYWPVGIAASVGLAAISLAFFYVWLMLIAFAGILFTVGGLLFEYYSRANVTH
ncbi:MAG: cytochrome c oxidase subunit 4 [Geodermatophilaceae bacterium]|nr:cytochrome c oxidase subunit 4 [Geodermatophilaceae bacterium]